MQTLSKSEVLKLHRKLNVFQMAAFVACSDPLNYSTGDNYSNGLPYLYDADEPEKFVFSNMIAILEEAIIAKDLAAELRYTPSSYKASFGTDNPKETPISYIPSLDLENTYITISSVKHWMINKGVAIPNTMTALATMPFFDENHTSYTPKLAACLAAWLVFANSENNYNKEDIINWLKKHATEYGVTNDKDTTTTFEMMATIVNPNTKGGRPSSKNKTASSLNDSSPQKLFKKTAVKQEIEIDFQTFIGSLKTPPPDDDDLPF